MNSETSSISVVRSRKSAASVKWEIAKPVPVERPLGIILIFVEPDVHKREVVHRDRERDEPLGESVVVRKDLPHRKCEVARHRRLQQTLGFVRELLFAPDLIFDRPCCVPLQLFVEIARPRI